MTRFAPALLLALALTACATERVSLEGLRPRAAEAIDPRVPLPTEAVAGPVTGSLAERVAAAEARADGGRGRFAELLPAARAAAGRAGARGSESWLDAQQLLSGLVAARAPVTLALGDLDAIGGQALQGRGDLGVADRKRLFDAAQRIGAIDAEQQAAIAAIRASLAP